MCIPILAKNYQGFGRGYLGGGGVQGHLDPLQNRTLIPPTHTWQTKLFLVLDPPPQTRKFSRSYAWFGSESVQWAKLYYMLCKSQLWCIMSIAHPSNNGQFLSNIFKLLTMPSNLKIMKFYSGKYIAECYDYRYIKYNK